MLEDNTYGVPTAEFISPLESAATLGIMKNFNVYKPDYSCASFLEMEHAPNSGWTLDLKTKKLYSKDAVDN